MKKEKLSIIILSSIIAVSLFAFAMISITFSKYQTKATGKISSNIAFYLTKADYQVKQIKLGMLMPSHDPYIYTFTVSNQDGNKVSDVDINYVLKIITTTNLPLRFELYMNEEYDSNGSTNLISSGNTVIESDEYGTYFQTITMDGEDLLYNNPKTNNYTLLVYYDENDKDAKYQDTVESVRLIVESSQIIE